MEEQTIPEEIKPSSSIPEEASLVDKAAHDYRTLIPVFEKQVEYMSKNQLQRLILTLAKYPLEMEFPKHLVGEDRKAFLNGLHIFDCKHVMINAVLELTKSKEKMAKFQQELDETLKKQEQENKEKQ